MPRKWVRLTCWWMVLMLPGGMACDRLRMVEPVGDRQWPAGSTVQWSKSVKGDEVWVRLGSEQARLRLLGVYSFVPVGQQSQDMATMAQKTSQYLQERGQTPWRVYWDSQRKDSYGRWLAYVEADGQDLAYQMVQSGLLLVYTEFPFAREQAYFQAEQQARTQQQGLWAFPQLHQDALGLRKQWLSSRQDKQTSKFVDPLLVPQMP